jgi:riboflavin synthase
MFTGIIRNLGKLVKVEVMQGNLELWIKSDLTSKLSIDESVAHNGICLTVVEIVGNTYRVTAIEETRKKTTIDFWKPGDEINLETSLTLQDKLDGHQVQGHVDLIAVCSEKQEMNGSWNFRFKYKPLESMHKAISKGSIAINGISLTVVNPDIDEIGVSIIPYTYEHTNMKHISPGSSVNLEFDIFGKYIHHYLKSYGVI